MSPTDCVRCGGEGWAWGWSMLSGGMPTEVPCPACQTDFYDRQDEAIREAWLVAIEEQAP